MRSHARNPLTRLALLALCPILAGAADESSSSDSGSSVAKATAPPPFFLQDSSDGLCLSGALFRRCAIDTLWYVTGTAGTYSVHLRPGDEDEDGVGDGGTDQCLLRKGCEEVSKDAKDFGTEDLRVGPCGHCSAGTWNILGDATTGYVLSSSDGALCLHRDGEKSTVATCEDVDHPYTAMQLQFASKTDIEAMSAPGARLITAASDGDKKFVSRMLKDGIDVNSADWDKLTPLIAAASAGHAEVVKLLLSSGADANGKDKDDITALMEAAIMGHADVVKILLDGGAEPEATATSGVTALWLASGEGRTEVMKILLAKGSDAGNTRSDGISCVMAASVGGHAEALGLLLAKATPEEIHKKDKDGLTALMNAAENGTVPCIDMLLDAKAEIDAMSETGFTALIVAAAGGHVDASVKLLERGANADSMHPDGVSALMYAAAGKHLDVAKALIEGGSDVTKLHSHGGSATMEAATAGATEVLELLISKGASHSIVDKDGVTTVMSAASQGHLESVRVIVEAEKAAGDAKPYIDLTSNSGGTAIMFAASGGHTEILDLLVTEGGDVNIEVEATAEYIDGVAKAIADGKEEVEPHVDGVTALHVAAMGGHIECAKSLITAGAKVSAKDDEDKGPLMNAVKGNYGDVASLLVENGADPNETYVDENGKEHNLLMDAIIVENLEFSSLLIKSGAELTHVDNHKVTVLVQAAHRGLTSIVDLLLEHGKDSVDVNAPSDEGITAIIAASSEGHEKVVQALIGAKADVDAKDKDGTTALMAAAVRGHKEIAAALLAAGASVDDQNADGHTALMFAHNGRTQVATLWERYSQYLGDATATEKATTKQLAGGEGEAAALDAQIAALDDAGNGDIIKTAMNNHTSVVDMLVKHGADATLKDKEGHTASDFDYKPPAEKKELGDGKEESGTDEL
mmetsp:Transcript_2039/g.4441  ORF Transcript_2039/g.4441 Transcript_2039/m.4441 type:complete len:919 (+) Transcript_2039:171-2927(+)|eukprot:CAMPEP_0194325188 /NCGR_PEP_ID=MMETSP0171-20130528/29088_1 /TAXON_ID=218684 /ORGANISM="Corethron pennatum, Strain L29A3" /LENGTH=918 /DNA_ID=CAMNT_0039084227 /DNA_START=112 /DNA_END=2868 /DNA_ORIENTATION=-